MRDHDIYKEEREVRKLVNRARQELDELTAQKQQFLNDREKEAEAHIEAVLAEAEAALDVAFCEYQELSVIRNQIEGVVNELTKYKDSLEESNKRFKERREEFSQHFYGKMAELQEAKISAQNQLEKIKAEWARLEHRGQSLDTLESKLKDERAKLNAAAKELYG